MNTATKVALAAAIATVAVVICWHGGRLQYAESQLATVSQSQDMTATKLAAIETKAEDRVINLPEDGGLYHTSLFLHHDWRRRPRDRMLLAWFGSNPRLLSLRHQTFWHIYTERTPLFVNRYSKTVRVLPCVRVQWPNGRVVYQASGENLPKTANGLAVKIVKGIYRLARPRPCPRPHPAPDPAPEPDVDVDVNVTPVIPDVTPDTPTQPEFPWGLLVIAVLLASAVPVVIHFKNAFRG